MRSHKNGSMPACLFHLSPSPAILQQQHWPGDSHSRPPDYSFLWRTGTPVWNKTDIVSGSSQLHEFAVRSLPVAQMRAHDLLVVLPVRQEELQCSPDESGLIHFAAIPEKALPNGRTRLLRFDRVWPQPPLQQNGNAPWPGMR